MRQGVGQANPDPPSPGSPSPSRRRRGRRRWLVWMLTPLGPVGLGVYGWGWLRPTEALLLGLGVMFGPVVMTAMEYDGVISIVPKEPRPRWIAWAIGHIGYGVLCGAAVAVGAWLAR